MESKNINQNSTTGAAAAPRPPSALLYRKTDFGWGLEGLYEGQKLVFSESLEKPRSVTSKLRKILNFKNQRPSTGGASIIPEIDIYQLFSPAAKLVWQRVPAIARKRHAPARAEDLFLSLLKDPEVQQLLARLRVNTATAETFLQNYLTLSPKSDSSVEIKKLPFQACLEAIKLHCPNISPLLLLYGLLAVLPGQHIIQAIFANIGLAADKLEILTAWLLDLEIAFPPASPKNLLLNCCRQAELLEQQFGYYYEYQAIDGAVKLAGSKALSLLVKAGLKAKISDKKTVTEAVINKAAQG